MLFKLFVKSRRKTKSRMKGVNMKDGKEEVKEGRKKRILQMAYIFARKKKLKNLFHKHVVSCSTLVF